MKTYGADILRGLAILIVFTYHTFGHFKYFIVPWKGWFRDFDSPEIQPLAWAYPITFGWTGVALFFVLSGFCIHLSFLKNKSFSFAHFFWRRFWRIYPAYLIALLTFAVCQRRHIDFFSLSGALALVSHLVFLHNVSSSTYFSINPSFWSIATEMQLYMLFPLLLLLRSRIGILNSLLATCVLGLVWRGIAVFFWGLPDHIITPALISPAMTWFDWTLGAFVAEKFFSNEPAFVRRRFWLALLVPLFVSSTLYKPLTVFSFSLAAVTGAVALDAALSIQWKKNVIWESFAFVGLVSYSLYLWHQPLIYPVVHFIKHLSGYSLVAFGLFLPVMIAGSWISYTLFERGGIHLGEYFWKRYHERPDPKKKWQEGDVMVS